MRTEFKPNQAAVLSDFSVVFPPVAPAANRESGCADVSLSGAGGVVLLLTIDREIPSAFLFGPPRVAVRRTHTNVDEDEAARLRGVCTVTYGMCLQRGFKSCVNFSRDLCPVAQC